ncbi:KRR1 interacting protein 1 [Chloropicon primus]|uniref:KRR1 interacting protein 1 n=1 Tax=Chloropicon primus TaxID=1764295 RepID=A0A5B8MSB5_9CHLO|nr:KRR1 interacting protein 1 [Chloropicon primus]UPR01409.1 KRR1 interacting protein 1 [Chloropicon primus]|eukprot:QDZ22192.1 KRR1 interacting protein 1 [Chloropicon primus]
MGRKVKKKEDMSLLDGSESESEDGGEGFKVNEEYARRFEHNKRREEMHRLQEKHPELAARLARGGGDLGEEDETSTSEDESGDDLISAKENEDMLRTLVKIRNRDPSIYKADSQFYSTGEEEEGGDGARRKKKDRSKNANTLRSIMARRALEEGAEALAKDDFSSEDEGGSKVMTYNQEQEQVRRAFTDAAGEESNSGESDGDDSDLDGLQQVKGSGVKGGEEDVSGDAVGGKKSKKVTQELLDDYFGKEDAMAEKDKSFLKDYIMNDGWTHKDGEAVEYEVDDQEDERYLEQAETFETNYNFRFEEPDSARIETFPRVIESSIRKKESKRKRQRESKQERTAKRKEEEALEVKRLKNLKKAEIRDKLEEIRKVSGLGEGDLDPSLLEDDFDPDKFDASLEKIFNGAYYGQEDKELDMKESGSTELNQLLEEYDKIDYEDRIGDIKCRFNYKEVSKNDFGIDAIALLSSTDAELNQMVSKKALAPYSTFVPKNKPRYYNAGGQESKSKKKKKKDEAKVSTTEERRADSYALPTLGGKRKKEEQKPATKQYFNKGEKKRAKRAEKRRKKQVGSV